MRPKSCWTCPNYSLEDWTFNCSICHKEQINKNIEVAVHPMKYGQRNISFCADNPICKEKAFNWSEPK
jgi:hypothetical protein